MAGQNSDKLIDPCPKSTGTQEMKHGNARIRS